MRSRKTRSRVHEEAERCMMAQQDCRPPHSKTGRDPRLQSYRQPVLTVWGRIEDLTRGSRGAARDVVVTPYRNIE